MRSRTLKQLQDDFLEKMYEHAEGKANEFIDLLPIEQDLGISDSDGKDIFLRLREQGLIDGSLGKRGYITPYGREQIEDFMEKTYAEEELLVLKTAADLTKGQNQGWIMWNPLEQALPELKYPLRDIVNELERKRFFLHEFDEGVKVGPQGYEFLQQRANRDTGFAVNYNQNITTGHGSPVVIGDSNTVVTNTSVNPEFDSAILALTKVIETSSMPTHEMRLALDDLVELQKLAAMEKSPGIVARATKIIGSFKVLADVAGLAGQIAPYVPQILTHFQN